MSEPEKSAPAEVERLVMLTDGVLAITMTLLVLDIRLPNDVGRLGDAALWQAIGSIQPQIYSYMLSFLVIANFWMSHARKFQYVKRVTGALVWLNIAFLMTTGLVPFTTSVLAENGGATATALYAAVMAASSAILAGMSGIASRAGLLDERVPQGDFVARVSRQGLLVAGVFVLSIPLAFWNADWGKLLWLLLVPISVLQVRQARASHPR